MGRTSAHRIWLREFKDCRYKLEHRGESGMPRGGNRMCARFIVGVRCTFTICPLRTRPSKKERT